MTKQELVKKFNEIANKLDELHDNIIDCAKSAKNILREIEYLPEY